MKCSTCKNTVLSECGKICGSSPAAQHFYGFGMSEGYPCPICGAEQSYGINGPKAECDGCGLDLGNGKEALKTWAEFSRSAESKRNAYARASFNRGFMEGKKCGN